MNKKNNDPEFEKTLREIMDSNDPSQPMRQPERQPAATESTEPLTEQGRKKKVLPRWAEWLIRMAAAMIAALLLAAFGMHVALR
jgi:hypothetical protein